MDDIRKYIDAYKLLLNEDDDDNNGGRRDQSLAGAPEGHAFGHGRREDLDYVEKKVKGVLDRVTLELKGSDAGVFTRLGRRYDQLEMVMARLQSKRNTMNIELKDRTVELFDAEDEILTRVLKTAKITLTLGKMEKRTASPKFNSKQFLDAVYSLAEEVSNVLPELTERIRALETEYTTIGDPYEVSPKLRIKTTPDESIKEEFEEEFEDDDWEEFDIHLQNIYDRMDQLV